ncbi:DUF3152 domain-containing protein [Actinacidiphila glaucinigra]|uniref:DUF3152 domain-containing protein n=1 Tax=Actinacidiphila glaucinigra TaxID=235986 RepID=UPI003D90E8C2
MGRHSAPGGRDGRRDDVPGIAGGTPGGGRRRRPGPAPNPPRTGGPGQAPGGSAPAGRDGFRPGDPGHGHQDAPGRAHPEHQEHSAWGRAGSWVPPRTPRGTRPAELADTALGTEYPEDDDPLDGRVRTAPRISGFPRQRRAPGAGFRDVPGPRKDFVEAFDVPSASAPSAATGPGAPVEGTGEGGEGGEQPEQPKKTVRTRALSGAAAAAVVTVLAVVVAGQMAAGGEKRHSSAAAAAPGAGRDSDDAASRSKDRVTPSASPSAVAAPLTYGQAMTKAYPLDQDLSLAGKFQTVGGREKAPGRGTLLRVRVDVEKGLPLNARLFADAVYKTLNDKRSWAHGGARTFERVSTGPADIVITLASPGTTATWCAKSDLDTTVDNVSCDAASTPRTMINAYRWAQGSETYGQERMLAYREMLINHEVGHRLGYGHVLCPKEGALAPVMMQQTKFLNYGGLTCKPNAWPYPRG